MRVSFHQRRRIPNVHVSLRAEGEPVVDVPAGDGLADEVSEPSDDELSDDGVSSDEGESSDDEEEDEDEDEDDDVGSGSPQPTEDVSPSTSLGPGPAPTSVSGQLTTIAIPATTPLTTPQPTGETTTASPAELSSPSSLPTVSTSTPSPQSSSPPVASASIIPILNPGDLETPTSTLPQSTDSPQLGGSTEVPESSDVIDVSNDNGGSESSNGQRAGQIAGGTIGSIAFVGLILLAIWLWRRRRSQNRRMSWISGLPPDDRTPQTREPGYSRSPSSIMNQLMTAAYAAEDGQDYRRSQQQVFDNYADEKQGAFTAQGNESTERLTVPAAAQMRPPSIAARTETTNRTESTWKTWGVLAGSSRPPAPRNWWVDRYLRA